MVARAPAKAILAVPLFFFLVALALLFTARNVAAPSLVQPLPIVVHTATTPQASSTPSADHGSSPSQSSSTTQQSRPDPGPPSSKVKTGDGTERASSCTSPHCPR